MDEALLSSLLPPPPPSPPSIPLFQPPSDLTYSPFSSPPLFSPSLALSPAAWRHSPASPTRPPPPFFVRASAIQSGDGIKNQKVSLSKRHPGWRTLMSPWKFEIHMLSHFILSPPHPLSPLSHFLSLSLSSLTFSLTLFLLLFSPSSPPSSAIMYYSVRKRGKRRGRGEECKMH